PVALAVEHEREGGPAVPHGHVGDLRQPGRDGQRKLRRDPMRTTGFTLLESVIVLALASVITLGALGSVLSAGDATNEIGVEHDLISAADRGLGVLENDLRSTSFDP